jgi:DNA-directed RNA polymerase specialized sigma24 family protein
MKAGFTLNLNLQLQEAVPVWKDSADKRTSLYIRASQYRRLLHFVAYRVLGNPDSADIAVENCLYSASRRATAFDCDGAFRSWLVRVAIDEALAILRGKHSQHGRELGAAGMGTALFSSQYEMFLDKPRG